MPATPAAQPAPDITLGKSEGVGRTVRGGIQGGIGAFIVEGIMLFNILTLDARQAVWLGIALGVLVAAVQNFIEGKRGQQFIGAAPQKAVKAPRKKKEA